MGAGKGKEINRFIRGTCPTLERLSKLTAFPVFFLTKGKGADGGGEGRLERKGSQPDRCTQRTPACRRVDMDGVTWVNSSVQSRICGSFLPSTASATEARQGQTRRVSRLRGPGTELHLKSPAVAGRMCGQDKLILSG